MKNIVINIKVIKIDLHFYSQTIASKTVPYFDLNKGYFLCNFPNVLLYSIFLLKKKKNLARITLHEIFS